MPLFSGTGVSAVSTVSGTAPITSTGGNAPVISLNNTAVVAGTYTSPTITVDAQGRLTSATNGSAQAAADASSIRAAASDYVAVAFDGATSGTRVTSTMTGQAIGTGEFSVWVRARVLSNSAGSMIALGPTAGNPFGADSVSIYLISGTLFVAKRSATDVFQSVLTVANFTTTYANQVVDVVVTKSTTSSLWSFYTNGTLIATSALYSTENVADTYCHIGAQVAVPWLGRIYRAVVFNRVLSQSDVTELGSTGVNPADQWGTQTQLMNTTTNNGGFETAGGGGADVFASWGEYSVGTAVITRDTVDFSPNLSSTASAKIVGVDGTAVAALNASGVGTLSPSKRYRLSVAHKTGAGNNVPWIGNATNAALVTFATTTSWANYSVEFVMPVSDSIKFLQSGATTIWADNVILERIGAIVDLDFTVGAGYQAFDKSTNSLHGTLFGGVEFVVPRRSAVLYATTNFLGNQQMLGTLAIPTNAIIEDIIVNSTGAATVSVGNASSGTQIVNAFVVASGRQKLTIATPFSTTGNLWVNSSTAAVLQFTIAYTIAS